MTRQQRVYVFAVFVSIAAGTMFSLLPRNWIELRLGSDPDGGSGLLESLLISIPIVIAAGIAILAPRSRPSVPLDVRPHSASSRR
jgi:hypothetical protein